MQEWQEEISTRHSTERDGMVHTTAEPLSYLRVEKVVKSISPALLTKGQSFSFRGM